MDPICRMIVTMRHPISVPRSVDASSFAGIVSGLGLLLPALVAPGLELLALPALVVLVPSLLCGLR